MNPGEDRWRETKKENKNLVINAVGNAFETRCSNKHQEIFEGLYVSLQDFKVHGIYSS